MTVKVQKRLRDLDSGVANAALVLIPYLVQVGFLIIYPIRRLKIRRRLSSLTTMPGGGQLHSCYSVGRTALSPPNYLCSHIRSVCYVKLGERSVVPSNVSP